MPFVVQYMKFTVKWETDSGKKKELRIFYKGEPIEKTYIPDLYCYDKIIVEIKAVDSLSKEHRSQLLNYLRLTGCKLGLLVNFCAYPKAIIEQWAN